MKTGDVFSEGKQKLVYESKKTNLFFTFSLTVSFFVCVFVFACVKPMNFFAFFKNGRENNQKKQNDPKGKFGDESKRGGISK